MNRNSYISGRVEFNPPKLPTTEPIREEPKREVTAENVGKYLAAETSVVVEGEVEDAA